MPLMPVVVRMATQLLGNVRALNRKLEGVRTVSQYPAVSQDVPSDAHLGYVHLRGKLNRGQECKPQNCWAHPTPYLIDDLLPPFGVFHTFYSKITKFT